MNEPKVPAALPQWAESVARVAADYGLDPSLVLAVVWQESSGQVDASRFEPNFVWFFSPERGPLHDERLTTQQNRDKAKEILGDEEFSWQSTSHGLMQVMGALARELGYESGAEEFCHPPTNLDFGCRYLLSCLRACRGNTATALLRYNGGGNPDYPDEVLEKWRTLKTLEMIA